MIKKALYLRYRLQKIWWRINPRVTDPYIKLGLHIEWRQLDFKIMVTPLYWRWGREHRFIPRWSEANFGPIAWEMRWEEERNIGKVVRRFVRAWLAAQGQRLDNHKG